MNDPFVAYRFAQGEEVTLANGVKKRIRKPLDFAAVTDHAEALGEYELCTDPFSAQYKSPICTGVRGGDLRPYGALFSGLATSPAKRMAAICGEDGKACHDAIDSPWKRRRRSRATCGPSRPTIAPSIRPGDLVVSTQPEHVPALYRYLPAGVVYLTPMGLVSDPRQTDWRDGLKRLRAGQAETRAAARDRPPARAAGAILIVTPVPGERLSQSPWARAVRIRTREWRAALRRQPAAAADRRRLTLPWRKNTVRAELYEVR